MTEEYTIMFTTRTMSVSYVYSRELSQWDSSTVYPNIILICTGMVTALTIAVYFIFMNTYWNLLNRAALLMTLIYLYD